MTLEQCELEQKARLCLKKSKTFNIENVCKSNRSESAVFLLTFQDCFVIISEGYPLGNGS